MDRTAVYGGKGRSGAVWAGLDTGQGTVLTEAQRDTEENRTDMMLALLLCISLLVSGAVTGQEHGSTGSQLTSFARALADSPGLGDSVERALSRALDVPQPRLAGIGTAVQGLFGSLALANVQSLLPAAVPGIAAAALIISIIALVKVGILFKSSGLSLFDTITETVSYGTASHGYAAGTPYGGYRQYDPTEYVHHEEHGHHDIHGDVSGYAASRRAQNLQSTGQEGRHRSSTSASSSSDTHSSKSTHTPAKPGRVMWS